jgi:hypothetical protein
LRTVRRSLVWAEAAGWVDVWMCGRFGWEYKGKHKDLDKAYQ